MITDLVIVDTAAWAIAVGAVAVVFPAAWICAFLLGRWAAWRWYAQHAHEFADADTRERNKVLALQLAERGERIDTLERELSHRGERIRELVAVIRAAQLTAAREVDVLITAANGRDTTE